MTVSFSEKSICRDLSGTITTRSENAEENQSIPYWVQEWTESDLGWWKEGNQERGLGHRKGGERESEAVTAKEREKLITKRQNRIRGMTGEAKGWKSTEIHSARDCGTWMKDWKRWKWRIVRTALKVARNLVGGSNISLQRCHRHKRTPVDECGVQDMVNLGRIFSSYRHKHIFAPGRCLITLHTANYTLYTAWWVCQCVDVCVHVYMCKWLMVYRYTKCAVINSGWLAIAVSGLLSTCIWCRDSKKHLYPCTYIYINQFLHTAHDFALLFLYSHVHIVSFYHCTFRNLARLKIRRVLTSF